MDCKVAVGEGSGGDLRKPSSFSCGLEGDVEDGAILVFRVYAGEVFWCEAAVDMLAKVSC